MVTVTLAHTQNPDTEPLYVDVASLAASAAMSPTGSPLIDIAKWPSMLQAAGCKLHVACCWIAEGGCRLEDEA